MIFKDKIVAKFFIKLSILLFITALLCGTFIHEYQRKIIVSQINQEAILCDNLYKLTLLLSEKKLQSEMQGKTLNYIKSTIDECSNLGDKENNQEKFNEICDFYYNYIPRTENEKILTALSFEIITKLKQARSNRIETYNKYKVRIDPSAYELIYEHNKRFFS